MGVGKDAYQDVEVEQGERAVEGGHDDHRFHPTRRMILRMTDQMKLTRNERIR